jgi:sec-independent protein translocase protein TatA
MPSVGPFELIVFLLVIILLFGSTKLPKLAKSLGEAQKEFKKGVAESEAESAAGATTTPPRPPADERVTLTKAEYDALLAERDASAPKNAPPSV